MEHLGSVVVGIGFDRIRRPYSIIGEFGTHISVGNKYGVPGILKGSEAFTWRIHIRAIRNL